MPWHSFSIHYWIVFLETPCAQSQYGQGSLSVSTIGSYFLKPRQQPFQRHRGSSFSIHYWIVFLETICAWLPKSIQATLSVSTIGSYFLKQKVKAATWNSRLSFSIHYWIVFLETVELLDLGPCQAHFQYPLLDRISWNLCRWLECRCHRQTFSIHYWIVFLETRSRRQSRCWPHNLSVSTIGSYFLKLPRDAAPLQPEPTFSIHYWIVFLETLKISWPGFIQSNLSVSTIGSYFLKPSRASRSMRQIRSFSIHYWIVFLETGPLSPPQITQSIFQYPLLDRISWNDLILLRRSCSMNFQYPLLDRISWNIVLTITGAPSFLLSVSTIGSYFLKHPMDGLMACPTCAFSIHYWIVFLETSIKTMPENLIVNLSVSTIGSYFLKRVLDDLMRPDEILSVSTIGSYFLKLIGSTESQRTRAAFSIHYWIVFLETSICPVTCPPCLLSVSTIGSYFLKRWICPLYVRHKPPFQYPLLDRISWNFCSA